MCRPVAPTGSYLMTVVPTRLCRHPRACHLRPVLGPRCFPWLPVWRAQGCRRAQLGMVLQCQAQAGAQEPAAPSGCCFLPGVGRGPLSHSRGPQGPIFQMTQGLCTFPGVVIRQKTACPYLVVACNKTKLQGIICGRKSQAGGGGGGGTGHSGERSGPAGRSKTPGWWREQ